MSTTCLVFRNVCILLTVVGNLTLGTLVIVKPDIGEIVFPGSTGPWPGYFTIEIALLLGGGFISHAVFNRHTMWPVLAGLIVNTGVMFSLSLLSSSPGSPSSFVQIPGCIVTSAALFAAWYNNRGVDYHYPSSAADHCENAADFSVDL